MSQKDVNFLLENHREETLAKAKYLIETIEKLIRIYSPSGDEQKISTFIFNRISNLNNFDVTTFEDEKDGIYNIYIKSKNKKSSLLLNAHLDTKSNDEKRLSEVKLPRNYESKNGIVYTEKYDDLILGYDDKIGLAIILWLMEKCKGLAFNVLFTVQEEKALEKYDEYKLPARTGGAGIGYAIRNHKSFFDDITTTIFIDRAEDGKYQSGKKIVTPHCRTREQSSDIIVTYGGIPLCSSRFSDSFERFTQKIGTPMKCRESASKSDAYDLKLEFEHMNIINLAAGGYKEHKEEDYLNVFQSVRTLRVIEEYINENQMEA